MAERNDVNIKVGVTGAKKALDELTKVIDSYSKKEKIQQQLNHQAEINQLKQKEANAERLHKGRMLKEAERFKQALNNAKIESVQLTNRLKMIEGTAKTETTLAEQAAKSHKAKNSQIQSDLNLQHATQRAILETTTKTAEAAGRQEVATLRVAKAQNDVLRTEERAGAATNSRIASEVRLSATKEKTASQAEQNALREQNLSERLNNTRLIGINKIAAEERRVTAFNSQEERRVRAEALRERLAATREANAAERMEMSRTRFAQQQQDRETRIASQRGGFFGGILGPEVGGAVEALGRLNLAFMVVTNSLRPFTEAIQFSIQSFARYESATVGFNLQLMNMGRNISEGNRIVQEFNDGISDPTAVMRAVQLMAPMNLSYQKQIDLINAIRDGVVSMGGDVNEQLPLMVLAIRRGSSELLDNMGVTKNAEEVYKEFAKSIGRKVSDLKEDEKQTALVNAVIKENTKVSGFARQSADTLDGSMQRLSTSARTLGTNIGSYLAPGVREAIDLFERMAAAASRAIPRQETALEQLRRTLPTKEEARTALEASQREVTAYERDLEALQQRHQRMLQLYQGNALGQAQAMAIYQRDIGPQIARITAALETARYSREQIGRLMTEYLNTEQAANRQAWDKAGPLIKSIPVADDKTKKGKTPRAARPPRAPREPKPVFQGPDLSGALRRKEAERIQKEESERLQKNYVEWQKAEDKKAKLRSEQLEADYVEWQRIEDEKKKAEEQRIKETADFLESSYQVALSVLQGDFSAVFSVIGNTLKDSIIKSLSETEAVKGFVGSITAGFTAMAGQIAAALTGSLTTAFTAIGAILTGPFAPLIIAVGALGVLIAKTMGDASERAKKYAEDIKNLKDGIDKLLPKKELTMREQRQQKVAELETRRGQLLARLEKERKGTFFATRGGGYIQVDKNAIKGYENELGIVEQGIKDLSDVLNNDLNDPLSAAAIAAKTAGDAAAYAAENMKKQAESTQSMREFAADLEDKIFAQRIDQLVREGKMTEEEGRRQKENRSLQNESMDLYTKARDMAKGFVPGSFGGIEQATYSEAFQRFQSGDIAGMEAALRSMGIDPMEQSDLIKVWKNIEEYLTGKKQDINMPGSSPDKPMYTQVVNVRDFREAFPDSAYFRAPSVDTTRSLNANAVAYR